MPVDREDLKRRTLRAIDNASDAELERGRRDQGYAHDWLQRAVGWIANLMTILGGIFGGCFITTAVCEKLGKPDNHNDMETLRLLRDSLQLLGNENISKDIVAYYFWSPALIRWANSRSDSDKIWQSFLYITMQTLEIYKNESLIPAYSFFKRMLLGLRVEVACGNYPGT